MNRLKTGQLKNLGTIPARNKKDLICTIACRLVLRPTQRDVSPGVGMELTNQLHLVMLRIQGSETPLHPTSLNRTAQLNVKSNLFSTFKRFKTKGELRRKTISADLQSDNNYIQIHPFPILEKKLAE